AIAEALSLQRTHAASPARIADSLITKAMLDIDIGKGDARASMDAAMQELDKATDASAELRLRALMVRAALLRRVGDTQAAVIASREALAFARTSFGDDAPQTARAWNVLAAALRSTGELQEAEQSMRQVIHYDRDIAHQLEPSHLFSLGTLQIDSGDYTSAT